jgi:dTDP-4-amino-4,6-dideoxygalactose transaminase
MNIPYCDLRKLHDDLRTELDAAFHRVLHNSSFILGPEVTAFEKQFAAYIGVRHAIGTSNGTTAILVALKALGVKPGDEVIVPAMTFYATGEAVAFLGATPVFVDIHPASFNLDPLQVRRSITSKTKVILPVHLYGQAADMDALQTIALEFKLKILGDCAHAHGAMYRGKKVGSIEDIGAFSFYPSKNLGSTGEAGIVTTNDDDLALLCRRFRDHGSTKKFEHDVVGTNARMDGLSAAILAAKLPHLDQWNRERLSIARDYTVRLSDFPARLPVEQNDVGHVFHIYQMQLEARDQAIAFLSGKGIGVTIHYPVPMHLHKGFSFLGHATGAFPVAEQLARTTLSLPCYPGMTEEQRMYVVGCVGEFFKQSGENSGRTVLR